MLFERTVLGIIFSSVYLKDGFILNILLDYSFGVFIAYPLQNYYFGKLLYLKLV